MGRTTLNIRRHKDDPDKVDTWFTKTCGGAERWREIVDGWDEAVLETAMKHHSGVFKPDEPKSLGRGALLIMQRDVCAEALALWTSQVEVSKGLKNGDVEVEAQKVIPQGEIERARLALDNQRAKQRRAKQKAKKKQKSA